MYLINGITQRERTTPAISLKSVSDSKARKCILLGDTALWAIRFYQVQEMIAALAIFSVLFAFAAGQF
jgi:hypothetical protein